MQTRKVVFTSINEMVDFVRKIENYPYRMDMQSGHFFVNPRSLFGLINIGIGKEMELKVYNENCEDLFKDIEQYVAA